MLATVDHRRKSHPCSGPRGPWNTNESKDQTIIRAAMSAPTMLLTSIWCQLSPFRHEVVSKETILRQLADADIRSQCPLRHLPLTPHFKQCQLDFCESWESRIVSNWRRVIFSNGSWFRLSIYGHHIFVWRQSGLKSDDLFGHTISPTHPSRHYNSSKLCSLYFKNRLGCLCYKVSQMPFIRKTMFVHILCNSLNNVFIWHSPMACQIILELSPKKHIRDMQGRQLHLFWNTG